MRKFIFDVDGTLTESRQQITTSFEAEFLIFCCKFPTYIVTGSDHQKTIDQLGRDILTRCAGIFNCSGSDVYQKDKFGTADAPYKNIYRSDWEPPDELTKFLNDELDFSTFPNKTGNHIEYRPGGINFSILGRGEDNMKYRSEYVAWDRQTEERDRLAQNLRRLFPDLCITIGGETGLDISPKGHDKSQILHDFETHDTITFFGDKTFVGGNDYSIAHAIITNDRGIVHQVSDFNETWEILKSKYT